MTSSGPWYLPNTFVCINIPRLAGALNQPKFNTGSGSHAPKKYHLPSTHASTHAWLSSVCAQRGVYT